MSDELPDDVRPIADFFGLPGTAVVIKDFHVVRAIRALASIDGAPFDLVFGGGTALARAHRLVQRMSEDVDFKVVPRSAAEPSRSALRRQLGSFRDQITVVLHAAGFAFDPSDRAVAWARDEGRYAVWQLPYKGQDGNGEGLRPAIKVELNYAPLRQPKVMLPVRSFVAEALTRAPEVPQLACVSMVETAAEKLISLTRRTAMEMAGASSDPDPALVRHLYDLHMMRAAIEPAVVSGLARRIAEVDAKEFANQHAAYAKDIAGETRKAVDALRDNPLHRERYIRFMADMVYGEKAEFEVALQTLNDLASVFLR